MSVRAYRINKIERKSEPTMNMWNDEKLVDFLMSEDAWDGRNNDGAGHFEVSVETLKKAVENKELELDEYTIKELKEDIAWAEKIGDSHIQYECF